ncbi:MAG: LacI family DNA-binding transcriptional regulator [Verrucomicrobiota bacterium]
MATLKQIAKNLDLSVMAISKALRDAPDIGASTKERVRKEADRVGYVPNYNARSLRAGRTFLLGALVQEINEPFAAGVLRGIEDSAAEEGFQLLVSASRQNEDREVRLLQRMFERKVEAVFIQTLVRLQHRTPILEAARKYKTPLIFLDHYPADAKQFEWVSWVIADCYKAGRLAASHLLELGHKDILYFSGPPTASSTADHMSGFKKELIEAGFGYDDEKIFLSGLDVEGGRETMMRALAEKMKFTAIVCAVDAVAIGAIEILRSQGYRVPEDVSVVGFGDGILAAHGNVPLTTVSRPQVELGSTAFRHWIRCKSGKEKWEPKVIPVELSVRDSTGPCPSPKG